MLGRCGSWRGRSWAVWPHRAVGLCQRWARAGWGSSSPAEMIRGLRGRWRYRSRSDGCSRAWGGEADGSFYLGQVEFCCSPGIRDRELVSGSEWGRFSYLLPGGGISMPGLGQPTAKAVPRDKSRAGADWGRSGARRCSRQLPCPTLPCPALGLGKNPGKDRSWEPAPGRNSRNGSVSYGSPGS